MAINATEDETKGFAYLAQEPLFGEDFAEPFMPNHMSHPHAPKTKPLTLEIEGIYHHMPESSRTWEAFFNVALPKEI